MQLEWKLLSFNTGATGYRVVTDVTGRVTLTIDGVSFVTLEDILILEFAYFVKNWLDDFDLGGWSDFFYKSMDEEEEPLLALYGRRDGTYTLESCWSARPVRPIESPEAVTAFRAFLIELKNHLWEKHSLKIDVAFSVFR